MMKKNIKKIATITLTCVVALAVTGTLVGATILKPKTPEDVDKNIYVEVGTPTIGDIAITGEFVGKVSPNQHVMVFPKLQGEVLAVNFGVGDTVKEGDILCQLDARDLQFSVAQTKASISSAEAKLKLSKDIAQESLETYQQNLAEGTNSTLINSEAAVRTAENAMQLANTNLNSTRRTYQEARDDESDIVYSDAQIRQLRDAVSAAEIQSETAQLGLQQAETNLIAVKKQLADGESTIKNNVTAADLNANLSEQYIMLQKLQASLEDANVKAPISGTIEQCSVDPHDIASPQSTIFVISNKDSMTVTFNISEANLQFMSVGEEIKVEKNNQSCVGVITEISEMVGNGSGLYPVKATIEYSPFTLNSGSTVKIYADTQKTTNSILLPIDSVKYDDGSPFVYIFDAGIARKTMIETGILNEKYIHVVSGLTKDAQIITTWNSKLKDGAEVMLPEQENITTQGEESIASAEKLQSDNSAVTEASADNADTSTAPEVSNTGNESQNTESALEKVGDVSVASSSAQ